MNAQRALVIGAQVLSEFNGLLQVIEGFPCLVIQATMSTISEDLFSPELHDSIQK